MSEDLKYRLNQFEASPPAAIWDKVSSALDEWNEWRPMSERLQNAAVIPPDHNWEQISEKLGAPVIKISRPFRKIAFALYRVAASVIIVILLISGGWKWYQSSLDDNPGERDLQTIAIKKSSLLPSFPHDIQKSTKREKINDYAKSGILVRNAGSVNEYPSFRKAVSYTSIEGSKWLTRETPILIDVKPIKTEELESKHKSIIGNGQSVNYLVIKSPDGQSTRVSVKFAHLISYLVNDFESDASSFETTSEESKNWGKLINEWREKIMRSGYTPTSGNFLDIVEFKDFLGKNQ